MNKNIREYFLFSVLITLIMGDIFSRIVVNQSQILIYVCAYLVSLIIVERNFKSNDFFNIIDKNNLAKENIFFSGAEIKTEVTEENEEERYHRVISPSKMFNRKLLIMVFYVVILFATYKSASTNFEPISLLPTINIALILLAATSGHLLLPLFLNATFLATQGNNVSILLVTIYIITFLSSLIAFTQTNKASSFKDKNNSHVFIRNLFTASIPLFLCILVTNKFLKPNSEFINFGKINKLNHSAGHFFNSKQEKNSLDSHIDQKSIQKLESHLAEIKSQKNLKLSPNEPASFEIIEQNLSTSSQNIENIQKVVEKIDLEKKINDEDYEQIQKNLNNITKNEIENMKLKSELKDKNLYAGITKTEEISNLSYGLSKLNSDKNEIDNKKISEFNTNVSALGDKIKQERSKLKKVPELDEINKKVETIHSTLQKLEKGGAISAVEERKLKNSLDEISELHPELNKDTIFSSSETPPLFNDDFLKLILGAITKLTPLILLIILILFLKKLSHTTPISKLQQFRDENEFKEIIKNELKLLHSRSYSMNEEIIITYGLIYKLFKQQHFPETEAPPPTELYQQIKSEHLSIQKSLCIVTETFCGALYGEHPTSEHVYLNYKKAMSDILKSFGMKY